MITPGGAKCERLRPVALIQRQTGPLAAAGAAAPAIAAIERKLASAIRMNASLWRRRACAVGNVRHRQVLVPAGVDTVALGGAVAGHLAGGGLLRPDRRGRLARRRAVGGGVD